MKTSAEILEHLRSLANADNVAGMARYGINPAQALGISMPVLRDIGRDIRHSCTRAERHALSAEIWASGVHEARILASLIDDPALVDDAQMEAWASVFDSWDLVDQCCSNLFDKTPTSRAKALVWSARPEEFVRRAGFTLMAALATHDRRMTSEDFEPFFAAILERASDERNFVRKAVNWALRGIGKRSLALNIRAIEIARQMETQPSKSARWNAKDALKELTSPAVQARLK
jgi:3-methyladenine DNA glycosylase AlkD